MSQLLNHRVNRRLKSKYNESYCGCDAFICISDERGPALSKQLPVITPMLCALPPTGH